MHWVREREQETAGVVALATNHSPPHIPVCLNFRGGVGTIHTIYIHTHVKIYKRALTGEGIRWRLTKGTGNLRE